jgi:UDP-glucose 4-epimerase
LNIATGATTSFREIAQAVVKESGRSVPITSAPRSGPPPHDGYRPFDNAACRAAFPDFSFVPLTEGLAKAQHAETASG